MKKSAKEYRSRAEEMRAIADNNHDDQVRDTLFRMAEDYERMASSVDVAERMRTLLGKKF